MIRCTSVALVTFISYRCLVVATFKWTTMRDFVKRSILLIGREEFTVYSHDRGVRCDVELFQVDVADALSRDYRWFPNVYGGGYLSKVLAINSDGNLIVNAPLLNNVASRCRENLFNINRMRFSICEVYLKYISDTYTYIISLLLYD